MAYLPSLDDIPSEAYKPSLDDLIEPSKSQSSFMIPEQQSHHAQEEFSNPTQQAGFEKLSKKDQLERIKFSAFDPANQTAAGAMLPPGTLDSSSARLAATILPTLALPEFSLGKGLLSRYAINPLINSLARIGAGTTGNLAYEAPNINSIQDLSNHAKRAGALNTALEAASYPLGRLWGGIAEMFNPLKFATEKAGTIKNELSAVKSVTDEMYRPVNEIYDNFPVTVTPKNYLAKAGVERGDLYPDAKIVYDNFLSEPTFKNLHNLQSKLGKDWARISQHPATAEKAQLFEQMRESLKDKVQHFLSRDQNALNQYNLASEFAKDKYYPYLATPTLRKIAAGKMDVNPNKLAKSIQQGMDKTVGKSEKSLIPQDHPLRNHLNDLNKMINFGNAMQTIAPLMGGAVAGHILHPGMGGIAGGAVGGLGASQMANMAAKFGAPSMTGFIQNPLVKNAFNRYFSPIYYGSGRSAIGYSGENR